MARTLASLPTGSRVTDYISLGVVSRAIPREKIDSILASTGKASVRQREARSRLGAEPLRRLYEQVVVPIASDKTRGARYRTWRLISLDEATPPARSRWPRRWFPN